MSRITPGTHLATRTLVSIRGRLVVIPDPGWLVHLQFRRYAGCPVCNVHLRSLSARHHELVQAGIHEVVLFHSSPAVMLEFQGALPFDAVADPDKVVYHEFGVESMHAKTALDPRSWRAAARALSRPHTLRGAAGIGEGHMGLPAEFLIEPDGRVKAAHYGEVVDDHWTVDQVLALASPV